MFTVSPSPDSSSNWVSPPSRSRASSSASATSSSAWCCRRAFSSRSFSLRRSFVLGVSPGALGMTSKPDSEQITVFLRGVFLTGAAFSGAGFAGAFWAGVLAAVFAVALTGAAFLSPARWAGAAFFSAALWAGAAFAGAAFAGAAFFSRGFGAGVGAAFLAALFAGGAFVPVALFPAAGAMCCAFLHRRSRCAPTRRVVPPEIGRVQRVVARARRPDHAPHTRARAAQTDPEQENTVGIVSTMPFQPVDRELDLTALDARVLRRWAVDDTFAESLRRREDAPEWVFYEGPPTANGRPGIHHVWARIFKDLYPRFHTMRGKYVARKAGWDCHGLPVEVAVEKELGFSGKPQIEDFGIEAFNQRCRESVQRYVEDWSALTSRIGMWLDLSDAYATMSNEYIESVWWLFHELWDKELIYEGSKVVPYCGRCGTALSSHELGQPGAYQDITEDSVYVRFPVVDADFDLLVWTTTPWTLVSNVGAAVGTDIAYVRVRDPEGGRDLVLGADRVTAVLGED